MWQIPTELQYIAQAFYALSYVAVIYIFVRLVLNLRKERKLIEKEIKRLNKMLDPILNSKKAKLKQKAIEVMTQYDIVKDEETGQWIRIKREENE
jgi:heme/copper-type cytochrome/quinol oxidase subunit 1